jgi:hypothetical protein
MKHFITLLILITLTVKSQTPPLKEYPILCFKSKNSAYFFIIPHKNIYYYNFSDHMIDNFKELFWKKSTTLPIDTSALEMIGNTKIREDQLNERIKKELEK